MPGRQPRTEPIVDTAGLGPELRRLRRAGLSDMALRPRRYPALANVFTSVEALEPTGMLERLDRVTRVFRQLLARLPSEELRNAARVLFHVDMPGTPPPLDERRRVADRAYTGRTYAREPDTVQRFLERDVIDPMLIDAMADLAASPSRYVASADTVDHGESWEIDDMDRREFLRLMTISGALVDPSVHDAAEWAGLDQDGVEAQRVDHRTLETYELVNARLWRAFMDSRHKARMLRPVHDQLDVLVRGLRSASGIAVHERLCALASDLYQLAGEIFFDGNRYTDAAHCYALAATAAREVNAFDLWACALTRHAFIGIYEHQYTQSEPMLQLARRIAQRGDTHLSTRQWAASVHAQALAGRGQPSGCEQALDAADNVRDLARVPHNGGWLRFDLSWVNRVSACRRAGSARRGSLDGGVRSRG